MLMPKKWYRSSRIVLRLVIVMALLAVLLGTQIEGGVHPAQAAAIGLNALYSQNFDTLANTGTNIPWTDDATISGWYSTRTAYNTGNGGSNTGALYSFGATASTERALGSVGSGSTGTIYYGARFVNNTLGAVTELAINYDGEQWRNSAAGVQSVGFSYQVGATSLTAGVWTGVAALAFASPTTGGTAAALNPPSVTAKFGLISGLTLGVGQEIWLRWEDIDHAGSDHGMAIDNLLVEAFVAAGDAAPAVSTISPSNGALNVAANSTIQVNFSENVALTASAVTLVCNGSPVTFTGLPVTAVNTVTLTPTGALPDSASCTVTVVAAQVSDSDIDDPPDNMAANFTSSFSVAAPAGTCPVVPTISTIGAVQGAGNTTPLAGSVTVRGRVTGSFQAAGQLGGFFVQNAPGGTQGLPDADPASSDGIFVLNSTAVSVGDIVQVTGTVSEFAAAGSPATETQLGSATVTICGTGTVGSVTPLPITLPLPAGQTLERYEGTLLSFAQPLYVIENFQLGRFGSVRVADSFVYQYTQNNAPSVPNYTAFLNALNEQRSFSVDDGSNIQNPATIIYPAPGLTAGNTLRGRDTFTNLTGVLRQTQGVPTSNSSSFVYRLHPVTPPTINAANPRLAPPVVPGEIKVATANLLNYFNGNGSGLDSAAGGFPTARGANNLNEFTRQRAKTIAAISALNADIIGLVEVENDAIGGGLSAVEDLVSGLNTALGAGTYAIIPFTANGVVGTDEIRVGIIYKPSKVSLIGTSAALPIGPFSAPFSVSAGDINKSRVPVAQAFQVLSGPAAGEQFIVVVNHFKSKSGTGTGSDLDINDGQGNWNATRVNSATQLLAWLASNPTGTGVVQTLIIGDLNAYALEDPITTLTAAGYTDILKARVGNNAYSFTFSGQAGYLDHVLASAPLAAKVQGVAEWHNNADEPTVLDYNVEFKTPAQQTALYATDPYRASDHDPALVGLFGLGAVSPVAGTPGLNVFDPAISKIGILQPGQLGAVGETVTWQITVTNPGTAVGQNVAVTDTLRDELRINLVTNSKGTVTISGQTVRVEIGTLTPGETVTISIETTVTSAPAGNTLTNSACITTGPAAQKCVDALRPVTIPAELPATGFAPVPQSPLSNETVALVALIGALGALIAIRLRRQVK